MDHRPTTRSTLRAKAASGRSGTVDGPRTAPAESSLGRGMEFAIVVLAFLGLGYVLDRIFDTKPVFMIILVVLSLIGQFASMWYGYDARMQHLEAERLAATTSGTRTGTAATGGATATHTAARSPRPASSGRMYEPALARPITEVADTTGNESADGEATTT